MTHVAPYTRYEPMRAPTVRTVGSHAATLSRYSARGIYAEPGGGLRSLVRTVTAVTAGAVTSVGLFFAPLVLNEITGPPDPDLYTSALAGVSYPEPEAPPVEPEVPDPIDEPEPPPPMELERAPLNLGELEIALLGGVGGGFGVIPGARGLADPHGEANDASSNALFTLADLDERPVPSYQPGPQVDATARKQAPGTVHIGFVVDPKGRVTQAKVLDSTHSALERSALAAVRRWKFLPGKRGGKPVAFRMRVPITYPAELARSR